MPKDVYPQPTQEVAARRKKLAPEIHDAFTAFSERVFAEGALPAKTHDTVSRVRRTTTRAP